MGEEPVMASSNDDWEARDDVDTVIKANEIMNDPKRKKRALAEIQKRNNATDKAEQQLEAKTTERLEKLGSEK